MLEPSRDISTDHGHLDSRRDMLPGRDRADRGQGDDGARQFLRLRLDSVGLAGGVRS